MKKRILALALTLAMLLSLLPAQAFATEKVEHSGQDLQGMTDVQESVAQAEEPKEAPAEVTEAPIEGEEKAPVKSMAVHSHTNAKGELISFDTDYETVLKGAMECVVPAGYYYLTKDITLKFATYPQGDVYLCLNGYTIDLVNVPILKAASAMGTREGGRFFLCNCSKSGGITRSFTASLLDPATSVLLEGGGFVAENVNIQNDFNVAPYGAPIHMYYNGESVYDEITVRNSTLFGTAYAIYNQESNAPFTVENSSLTSENVSVHTKSDMTLAGSVEISGTQCDIFLVSGATVSFGENFSLANGEQMKVQTNPAPTVSAPVRITTGWSESGITEFPFISGHEGFVVTEQDGELWLMAPPKPHSHCKYGHNCGYLSAGNTCLHEELAFATPLTKKVMESYTSASYIQLPAGFYVLTEDIEVDEVIWINGGSVDICLNGYTLTSTADMVQVIGGTVLRVCDCSGNGQWIFGKEFVAGMGSANWGHAYLYGGTFSNLNRSSSTVFKVGSNGSVLEVNGADLIANGAAWAGFAPSQLGDIQLRLISGSVTGIDCPGTVEMWQRQGAIIMGSETEACTVRLDMQGENDAEIVLYEGVKILVEGLLEPPAGETYVVKIDETTMPTHEKPVQITEGFGAAGNTVNPFVSWSEEYETFILNGEVYIGYAHVHYMSTDPESDAVLPDGRTPAYVFFSQVLTEENLPRDSAGVVTLTDGHYVLDEDLDLTERTLFAIDGNVDLCLNGYSITFHDADSGIEILQDASLQLCNCKDSGGITHPYAQNAVIFNQRTSRGVLGLYHIRICASSEDGSSVAIRMHMGEVEIFDCEFLAELRASDAELKGICVDNSQLEIYGSSMILSTGDSAGWICAIESSKSTLTLDGMVMELEGSKAVEAMVLRDGSEATVSNVTIDASGNETVYGIHMDNSTASILDSSVSARSVSADAYGVYDFGNLTLEGQSEIFGTTASFYLDEGKLINIGATFTVPQTAYKVHTPKDPEEAAYVQITTAWDNNENLLEVVDYPFVHYKDPIAYPTWKYQENQDAPKELYFALSHTHGINGHVYTRLANTSLLPAAEGYKLNSGYYVLNDDLVVNGKLRTQDGAQVYICLNGYTLQAIGHIQVEHSMLHICDCRNGIVKTPSFAPLNSGILHLEHVTASGSDYDLPGHVGSGGQLIIEDSVFYEDPGVHQEGGIYGWHDKATIQVISSTIIGKGTTGPNLLYWKGVIKMEGSVKLDSAPNAGDIYFYDKGVITISGPLTPPEGETYTVKLGSKLNPNNYLLTADWEKSGLASYIDENGNFVPAKIPFVSLQGYSVVERINEATGMKELYLCKLQSSLDLFLWKGQSVSISGSTFGNMIHSTTSEYAYLMDTGRYEFADVANLGFPAISADMAADTVILSSDSGGSHEGEIISVLRHVATNKVVGVSVSTAANVYEVQNSVYVLDYNAPAKIGGSVFANDILPGTVYGIEAQSEENASVQMAFEALTSKKPEVSADGLSMSVDQGNTVGKYGTFALSEDGKSLIYTMTDFMNGGDEIYLVFRAVDMDASASVFGEVDPFRETLMYKTITMLPANVVYYEDNFGKLNYSEEVKSGSDNIIEILGNEEGIGYQDPVGGEYGNDDSYTAPQENGSGNVQHKIKVNGIGTVLTFNFVGTGFDLIGRNTCDSGTLSVMVYELKADGSETLVYAKPVDTVFKEPDGAVYESTIIHYTSLAYGNYRVEIMSVPKNDYSTGTPVVKDSYLYVDGIRIYNSLDLEDPNRENYAQGEKDAVFTEIRNLVIYGQAASAKIENDTFRFGSGTISYTETAGKNFNYVGNTVTSVNDYLLAGHNNELHFNADTQALVFYVKAEDSSKDLMLQLGLRNLNSKSYDDRDDPVDSDLIPELWLLTADGEELVFGGGDEVPGYTEQYYTIDPTKCVKESFTVKTLVEGEEVIREEEYYRVVLMAKNSSAFAMTNVKHSNAKFYTIPGLAATLHYNKFGELIQTTDPTAMNLPNLQQLEWQMRAAAGLLPEDQLKPEDISLNISYVSLSLKSSIGLNYFVSVQELKGLSDPYILVSKAIYDEDGTVTGTETAKITDYERSTVGNKEYFVFRYNDIYAREMSAEISACIYASHKTLGLIEGGTRSYNAQTYAMNMLGKEETPEELKTLLVDMLNYGAASQVWSDYNNSPASLANALLTAEQKAYGSTAVPTVNNYGDKGSNGGDYPASIYGMTLTLRDSVGVNFYAKLAEHLDPAKVGLRVSYTDTAGIRQTVDMPAELVEDQSSGVYVMKAVFHELTASDMRQLLNAWITYDGELYSNMITYSIESYAASQLQQPGCSQELRDLLVAMMRYGDSTNAYFMSTNPMN